MLIDLINRECTLIIRSESGDEDEFGNDVPDETAVTTVCELQQRQRDEKDLEGEHSDTDWVVFFLPGEDLSTADALVVDGFEYEFVGDPWEARNPLTRSVSHLECSVRRTAGTETGS